MAFRLSNHCFELSAAYTVVLLVLYIAKRGAIIPLTYRSAFDGWGGVRGLFERATAPVPFEALQGAIWCPGGEPALVSSQCACFVDYYNQTYAADLARQNLTRAPLPWNASAMFVELGRKHSAGILSACLRFRPTHRKASCCDFCRVHLATPILLASLYMCLFFYGQSTYGQSAHGRWWLGLPLGLALAIAVSSLYLHRTGGIVSTLSVLSVLMEIYYTTQRGDSRAQVFWSYHRFLCAALAVWAGLTHQARDVLLLASYGMLGFFAGFLAYAVFLVKQATPCRHSGSVCLYLYMGIGVIVACFVLLVQQHWYEGSALWSSAVSVPLLGACLFQCFGQTPFQAPPVRLNVMLSLGLLTAAFLAVVGDLVEWG
jgi:hypothetical protein